MRDSPYSYGISVMRTLEVDLRRHIAPDIETLWDCGFSVSSVLIQFLQQWDKRVPVEQFLGSRSSVPAGTLESVRVAQVTYPLAEQILSRPQDWPTDLVRAAVDRLSNRLANQDPILQVAYEAAWGT